MTAEIVSINFESSLKAPDSDTVERFAARFVGRTVAHLDHVGVGAIVSAYLQDMECPLEGAERGAEILRLITLVETVLDEAKKQLHKHLLIDAAANLVPRLRPIPTKESRS